MSNLSPAAQEILDATRFEVNAECNAPWIAVAVLRALLIEKGTDILDENGKIMHFVVMQDDIRDIIKELDGV